jgi:predicted cupin superfamily sugar epimerase
MSEAERLIALLALKPHPEGGHFRETFRDARNAQDRSHSTAIYFLLRRDECSSWHRVDAAELWHWYAGAPLALEMSDEADGEVRRNLLGNDLENDQRPQLVVPANVWQRARSLGDFTLVGCTVAPGFEFSRFELAPSGRLPGN